MIEYEKLSSRETSCKSKKESIDISNFTFTFSLCVFNIQQADKKKYNNCIVSY